MAETSPIVLTNQVANFAEMTSEGDYIGPRAAMADENGTIVQTGVTELFFKPSVTGPPVRITIPPWLVSYDDSGNLLLTEIIDN